MLGIAHAGERFADVVGPAFKAGSRAPHFLTARRLKFWDFTPLPSSSAFASRFSCSLAPAAPSQLAPEFRSKARYHHVKLDAVQCVPFDVAPPR
jgi:hypothetical protein